MKRFVVLSLILLANLGFANADQVEERVAEELSNNMEKLKYMDSDYEKFTKSGSLTRKDAGHISLFAKGCFRMESQSPYLQMAVYDKKYLWDYDSKLKQVIKKSIDPSDPLPLLLLTGDIERFMASVQIKKHKYATLYFDYETKSYDEVFAIYSLKDSNYFQIIEILFKDGKPRYLHILGIDDSLVRMNFYNFSKKAPSEDICKFTPPKGVEIINGDNLAQ